VSKPICYLGATSLSQGFRNPLSPILPLPLVGTWLAISCLVFILKSDSHLTLWSLFAWFPGFFSVIIIFWFWFFCFGFLLFLFWLFGFLVFGFWFLVLAFLFTCVPRLTVGGISFRRETSQTAAVFSSELGSRVPGYFQQQLN
jgi:hypothetical protein